MPNFFKNTQRVVQNGKFIPQLDGLRFIAVISVVLFHANGRMSSRMGVSIPYISEFLKAGFFGVNVFFAISGFILTYQILRKDHFKYSAYLLRRIKRIEPPFLIAITLQTLIVSVFFKPELSQEYWSSFMWVITYTSNIFNNNLINGVTWSLEVEVQFYLVLPLIILTMLNLNSNLQAIIFFVILAVFVMFVSPWVPFKSLLAYFPYFGIGVITAWIKVKMTPIFQVEFGSVLILCLMLVLFSVQTQYFDFLGLYRSSVSTGLMFILFYIVLIANTSSSFLENSVITSIGGMCYTIYLYHIIILSIFSNFILPRVEEVISFSPLFFLIGLISMTFTSFLISIPIYLIFEKPFMYQKWNWSSIRRKEVKPSLKA